MDEGYVFGRKGDTYIMLHAISDGEATLSFKTNDVEHDMSKIKESVRKLIEASGDLRYDLILDGGDSHAWITELGSVEESGSFEAFVDEMIRNEYSYNNMTVTYKTGELVFNVKYSENFIINGSKIDTNYERYESEYVDGKIERGSDVITLSFMGKSLVLNYNEGIREE